MTYEHLIIQWTIEKSRKAEKSVYVENKKYRFRKEKGRSHQLIKWKYLAKDAEKLFNTQHAM